MINNTILQFIEYIYSISTISTLHQYMIKPVQIKLLELVDFFNISPLKPAVLYFRGGYNTAILSYSFSLVSVNYCADYLHFHTCQKVVWI